MTDNEIIKALEWLERLKRDTDVSEWAESLEIILNEYNRQKAEIEKLKAENEVMKTNCNSMYVSMPNMAKAERTEAIKWFAKMLIDKSENGIIRISDIPDYVKEMTEVNENE